MARAADVLLVEGLSGAVPFVVPMGVVDLLNRVAASKAGVYAADLADDEIRRARVIAVPIHWFYSIGPALETARRCKAVNPRAAIVSGGYTATAFDDALLAAGAIDYIVRGDADRPFPALVERLLDGRPVDDVPNITARGWRTPQSYAATPADLAAMDCRTIGWFPAFEHRALRAQETGEVTLLFPWVPVGRGCALDCAGCFAATDVQQALCGRPPIARPAHAVAADLQYFGRRRDVRHCHFNVDVVHALGIDHARRVLDGSVYGLDCYYEWYRTPDAEAIDLVRGSFARVTHAFFFTAREECVSAGAGDPDGHAARLEAALADATRGGARAIVYADPAIAAGDPSYARACLRLARLPRVRLYRYDSAIIPAMRGLDRAALAALYPAFLDRASRDLPALARRNRLLGAVLDHAPALLPAVHSLGARGFVRALRGGGRARA